jgi:CheY-like chemotaxis protein
LGNDADLREALTNLIFNAVDAMPQGGTVAITGRAVDAQVVLSVSDTGTGMTDEVRRRCLEPFFTTKGERGTGLGLSMVYGIVRRHAGTLDIQSEVGRGTTFVIRLPSQEKTAEANSGQTTEASISCPLRVLVVDDEPLVRNVEAKYLEAAGHSVARAASGPEGLEKFRAEKFDVVVLDRAMPGMSGDQLAAAVKQLSADTPVIMLTGFGDLMEATGEKPPHVDVLLNKPITLVGLQQAVRKTTTVPAKQAAIPPC